MFSGFFFIYIFIFCWFVSLCGPRRIRIYLKSFFSPPHRNVSKCWILSSISCDTNRKTHTHTHKKRNREREKQTRISTNRLISSQHSKIGCVYKSICATAVSILLGNFPQQTAFTMINDVKWSKAVAGVRWAISLSVKTAEFDTDYI